MIENSALRALYDEYERATTDLKRLLKNISPYSFSKIRDEETEDSDCKSIQTVVQHIVRSGFGYANYLQQLVDGPWNDYKFPINTPIDGVIEIETMMAYTHKSIRFLGHFSNEELREKIIHSSWKVKYDPEQMLEHAIVHILRHRRQIENFLK